MVKATLAKLVVEYGTKVPKVSKPMHIVCFILNIFFPGIGTIIAGIVKEDTNNIIYGLLQFILSCIIVGWLWSIFWGFLIYKRGEMLV